MRRLSHNVHLWQKSKPKRRHQRHPKWSLPKGQFSHRLQLWTSFFHSSTGSDLTKDFYLDWSYWFKPRLNGSIRRLPLWQALPLRKNSHWRPSAYRISLWHPMLINLNCLSSGNCILCWSTTHSTTNLGESISNITISMVSKLVRRHLCIEWVTCSMFYRETTPYQILPTAKFVFFCWEKSTTKSIANNCKSPALVYRSKEGNRPC